MRQLRLGLAGAGLLGSAFCTSVALASTADVPSDVGQIGGSFIGLAVGTAPDYEGSDHNEGKVAPFGRYSWASGRYISLGGTSNAESAARVKFNALSNDTGFELGPVLQYRFKRDDVDNHQVDRMKDVDAATELGAFVTWRAGHFSLGTTFVTDVSDEHDGSVWYFNGGYDIPVSDRFRLNIGAHVTWASDDYMETYFGVDSKNRGSSTLPNYKASGGIKDAGASLLGQYMFNQNWGVLGVVNYTRLLNDAEDSPLVNDEGDASQMKAFVGLTYSF